MKKDMTFEIYNEFCRLNGLKACRITSLLCFEKKYVNQAG